MVMSWTPTARRNGVGGLADLMAREEWRSAREDDLRLILRALLDDPDAVCRWHGARTADRLDPDSGKALRLVRERFTREEVFENGASLAVCLRFFVDDHGDEVDQAVHEALAAPWLSCLGDGEADQVDVTFAEHFIGVVLLLALRDGKPHASSIAEGWFEDPLASPLAEHALIVVRGFLRWSADHVPVAERAFGLLRRAAVSAERTREGTEPESAEWRGAYRIAGSIAGCVYLASGACGVSEQERLAASEGFAAGALPVLAELSAFQDDLIVEEAVKTLNHLAAQDPHTVLGLLRGFVGEDPRSLYSGRAGEAAAGLCARYLSEFRDVLLESEALMDSLREVLTTLVQAGSPEAIGLSYRLSDAFR